MQGKELTKEKNERAVKYTTSVVFLLMLFAQEQQQLVISYIQQKPNTCQNRKTKIPNDSERERKSQSIYLPKEEQGCEVVVVEVRSGHQDSIAIINSISAATV